MSHSLVKSGFRRSLSRAVCAGTCAACVRMLAPRGRPRECVVDELFIENHAPPSVGVHVSSEVCRVWTTCSRWRACGRISCAHALRTLAPNGSVWGGLGAELFTGLPECGAGVCGVRGALGHDHVVFNTRLYAHQLRACAAHLGGEWQHLGKPVGRDRHRFTSPPSSVVRVLCHTAWPSLDFIACLCALCVQTRARHVCACLCHAARPGVQPSSSY